MTGENPAWLVPLPPPLLRRMRFGPFPSATSAMKFLAWASLGLLVASAWTPLAALVLVGCGFVLCVHSADGEGLDRRAWDLIRWSVGPARNSRATYRATRSLGDLAWTEGGLCVVGFRAGGVPVAFLTPERAREMWENYRRILRSLDAPAGFWVGGEPVSSRPFLPHPKASGKPDASARDSYKELVALAMRRRRCRRIFVFLWGNGSEAAKVASSLVSRAEAFREGLSALGIATEPLTGRSLEAALREVGWSVEAETL